MLVGYVRVSKSDGTQSTDLQKEALLKAGVTEDKIYEDLASGKKENRPGLQHCLKALRQGDIANPIELNEKQRLLLLEMF